MERHVLNDFFFLVDIAFGKGNIFLGLRVDTPSAKKKIIIKNKIKKNEGPNNGKIMQKISGKLIKGSKIHTSK